jgi:hypothetical protein
MAEGISISHLLPNATFGSCPAAQNEHDRLDCRRDQTADQADGQKFQQTKQESALDGPDDSLAFCFPAVVDEQTKGVAIRPDGFLPNRIPD